VHWHVAGRKRTGEVIDIYTSGKVSNLSIRDNRETDRVVVIRLPDGKLIMKLEGDVMEGM
jgi:hypothetical protein